MDDQVLSARNVELRRGNKVIVPSLNVEVNRGALFGLVGPSGSGKTTIMRAILGLGAISFGEMTLFGSPVGDGELRSQIGYQPQTGGLWPDLSPRECLHFMRAIYRVDTSRIDEVLGLMGLQPFADQPVATLSGGQAQRVGLAMATLHEPPLLILDEPTVGLDPRLRHRLWREFRAWTDAGTTIILSTHVMSEAELCDTIAVVMNGNVIAVEKPGDLVSRFAAKDLEDALLQLFEVEDAHVL